jgi:hypothetical protein
MRNLLVYIALLLVALPLAGQEPDTVRAVKRDTVVTVMADTVTAGNLQERPAIDTQKDTLPARTGRTMPPVGGRPQGIRKATPTVWSPITGQDSTFLTGSRQWTLSPDFTTEIAVPLDTAFSLFHRYRVADQHSDFNAYTGNYGLPLYQINFFDREWKPDRFLYAHYMPFMFTPANTLFLNTHIPFTELKWSNGGARKIAEQTFRIRHSQNINRFVNFGLVYDIVYNIGQYTYQKAIDKNFLLHASYNGSPYTAYFSAGINNQESAESGGMILEDDLAQYAPETVPFNLNNLNSAKSILKNRYVMLVQRYAPGSKRDTVTGEVTRSGPVTFSHIGILEWSKRLYLDNYPGSELYDTVMISNGRTADSLQQRILSNTLRIDFAAGRTDRFRIGAGAGIRSELRTFGHITPGDTLTRPDTVSSSMSSLVLTGKVFNNIGSKFGWSATGDLWFQGYRAGDFIVDGRIYKEFETRSKGMITWDATGTIASYTPSFWYNTWGSNNFAWQYDHKREFRLMAGSSLQWPDLKMSLKFNYAIVDNFIRMGMGALPAQHEGGLSILALTAKKEFVVWKLHLDNTVLLQQSTNTDVLDLPLVTARSAFFFDHLFKFKATAGELYFQLGAEAMIHTPYYALDYMPATGRYFGQTESQTGNYPFINAFINLKVKRTRIFIMADHLNSGMTGYEYFLAPGYPLNIRMIKYGLAWTFYD